MIQMRFAQHLCVFFFVPNKQEGKRENKIMLIVVQARWNASATHKRDIFKFGRVSLCRERALGVHIKTHTRVGSLFPQTSI